MTDRLIVLSPAPIVRMPIPELFKGRPRMDDNCPACVVRAMIPVHVEHVIHWTCPGCQHTQKETSTALRLEFEARLR